MCNGSIESRTLTGTKACHIHLWRASTSHLDRAHPKDIVEAKDKEATTEVKVKEKGMDDLW
jgi:hypothetical protein